MRGAFSIQTSTPYKPGSRSKSEKLPYYTLNFSLEAEASSKSCNIIHWNSAWRPKQVWKACIYGSNKHKIDFADTVDRRQYSVKKNKIGILNIVWDNKILLCFMKICCRFVTGGAASKYKSTYLVLELSDLSLVPPFFLFLFQHRLCVA